MITELLLLHSMIIHEITHQNPSAVITSGTVVV